MKNKRKDHKILSLYLQCMPLISIQVKFFQNLE